MSQFDHDQSFLAQLLPNFRPSDFWFLHRRYNPAFGMFTNLFAQEASANLGDASLGTKPLTFAFVARPDGTAQESFLSWGDLPSQTTNLFGVQVDGNGGLLVLAGDFFQGAEFVQGSTQLPVGRMSLVVGAVNPGNGKLRVWRNGTPVITAQAAGGRLLGNRYANTDKFLKTSRANVGAEGNIIGRRVAIFLNQLPRAFG